MSSKYFELSKEEEENEPILPDYSDEAPRIEDEDIDETPDLIDEGALESEIDKREETKKENNNVISTPFGDTPWNNPATQQPSTPWGQQGNTGSSGYWGNSQKPGNLWGGNGGSSWGSGSSPWPSSKPENRQEINRSKKFIFIDFLDCIIETWQSEGRPGLLPRDIYDMKPKFDVWQKLAAFNPEKVYSILPINLISNTNGIDGWKEALGYFCCGLSAFLRVPYTSCQILAQSRVGQPKEEIMRSVIENPANPLDKSKVLSIGIYSGLSGQSDRDKVAADICGIDHLDLGQLLNNMY